MTQHRSSRRSAYARREHEVLTRPTGTAITARRTPDVHQLRLHRPRCLPGRLLVGRPAARRRTALLELRVMSATGRTWGERVDAGEPTSEVYSAVMELAMAVGATPIGGRLWTHAIDARWSVTANGFQTEKTLPNGVRLPPLHVYLEYNGWPAGVIGLFEGVIAAGEGANEDTFIAAVQAAIERVKS